MKRILINSILVRISLWLTLPLVFAAGVRAQIGTTPVFSSDATVHDPSVIRSGDTYYVFGSHLAAASTTDLMNWTQISTDPVANNPIIPNPTVELADAIAWVAGSYGFWAPDVRQLADGRYYLYYCIGRLDQPRAALGLAVSDSITGPYSDVGVMLRSGPGGQPPEAGATYDPTIHPNTIDPAVFYDQTGILWMVYGSYSGGIFILEMDPDTGMPLPDQGYGKHLIGGNHARIEGSYILYSPESEYYYLFVSYGGLAADGGYNIRIGRSRSPDGPYLDAAGTDLETVKGAAGTLFDDASIEPYGVKLMGNFQFQHVAGEPGTQGRGYVSPGHNSAYYNPETGEYLLFFHTRFVGTGEIHNVRVHQMFVNADDWLVVAPHRYAHEAIVPTDPARVPGDYKYVNHGKAITADVTYSTIITLHADGTVSGAANGTWALSADYDATLTLAGVVYHGVFVDQWDEDNQKWVLAFTALSGNGVSAWGSKVAIDSAPVIVTQPQGATVVSHAPLTLTVAATGDPAPTYQWQHGGVDIDGATARSLSFVKIKPGDAGSYNVVVSSSAGSVTSTTAEVSVTVPPTITAHPASVTQVAGTSADLSVEASGGSLAYQWFKDGVAIDGATSATLHFSALQASDAADYTVRITGTNGTVTSRFARVVVGVPVSARISNLSVRSTAGIAGQPLIVGFVVNGGSKSVLLRGIGPALGAFGVQGTMVDPNLVVHGTVSGSDMIFASNDNWGDGGQGSTLTTAFAKVGAFPLDDSNSKDAALITSVDGLRSVHANSAVSASSGVVLVEAYDLETETTPRLVNVSARNFAGTGSQTLIAGFVIDGTEPMRVLIRGVGPTLTDFGVPHVVADPKLDLHSTINQSDTLVATNDDWSDEPGVASASAAAGAFPLHDSSYDAAIVMTLPPGLYSAHVSGLNGSTGEALIEVYELP